LGSRAGLGLAGTAGGPTALSSVQVRSTSPRRRPLAALNSSRALFTASCGRASLQIRSAPLFQQYSFFAFGSFLPRWACAGSVDTASNRPIKMVVAILDMVGEPPALNA